MISFRLRIGILLMAGVEMPSVVLAQTLETLPEYDRYTLASDAAVLQAVISISNRSYVGATTLRTLPTPARLARFTNDLSKDTKAASSGVLARCKASAKSIPAATRAKADATAAASSTETLFNPNNLISAPRIAASSNP
jgi:hypothetical protein